MADAIDPMAKFKKEFIDILKEPASYLKIITIMLLCVTSVLIEGYYFRLGGRGNSASFQHFLVVCGPGGVAVVATLLAHRFIEESRTPRLEATLLTEWGTFCLLAAFCILLGNTYSLGLQEVSVPKYITCTCFFVAGLLMILDAILFSKIEEESSA